MDKEPKTRRSGGPGPASGKAAERRRRLAAALRQNLAKRRRQAAARCQASRPAEGGRDGR